MQRYCVTFGEFTLSSGGKSKYYYNTNYGYGYRYAYGYGSGYGYGYGYGYAIDDKDSKFPGLRRLWHRMKRVVRG